MPVTGHKVKRPQVCLTFSRWTGDSPLMNLTQRLDVVMAFGLISHYHPAIFHHMTSGGTDSVGGRYNTKTGVFNP